MTLASKWLSEELAVAVICDEKLDQGEQKGDRDIKGENGMRWKWIGCRFRILLGVVYVYPDKIGSLNLRSHGCGYEQDSIHLEFGNAKDVRIASALPCIFGSLAKVWWGTVM